MASKTTKRKTRDTDSKYSKKLKTFSDSSDEQSLAEDSADEYLTSSDDDDLKPQQRSLKIKQNFDALVLESGGLKHSQHGNIFQLNLLMLGLWRAKQTKYVDFRLATEFSEAEKFDDIVFQYLVSPDHKWQLRLLQAKHKDAETLSKITKTNLLSTDDHEAFGIPKYFRSFLKIASRCKELSNSVFSQNKIKDVILITNTDFDSEELRENFAIDLKNYIEMDNLLSTNHNQNVKKYSLKKPKENDLVRELIPIFYKMSDFRVLVEEIAERIFDNLKIDKNIASIKNYFYPLDKEVFKIEKEPNKPNCLKFKSSFLTSDKLDSATQKFRVAFIKEFAFIQNPPKLKVSDKFGNKNLPNGTELDMLAEKLAKSLVNDEELTIPDYEDYRVALTSEVINCEKGSFHYKFFNPGADKSNIQVQNKKKFRAQLKIEIKKIIGQKVTDDYLKAKKIRTSTDFGAEATLPNDNITLRKLAQGFKDALENGRELEASISPEFKRYHLALAKEVVDIDTNKFHEIFRRGKVVEEQGKKDKTKILSAVLKEFRRILIDELITDQLIKESIEILEQKELAVSKGFVDEFRPKEDPQLDDEKKLAQQIFTMMGSTDKLITIDSNSVAPNEFAGFQHNFETLAGHVLVKKYGYVCFRTSFLQSVELPRSIKEFHKELRDLLKSDFESINEFRFQINIEEFKTCDEEDIERKLPGPIEIEDIWNFFERFKIIVNYPNNADMIDSLEREMQDEFKNLSSKAWIALYQEEMHNWMANRQGTLYTRERASILFKKIKKNASCAQLNGVTKAFFSTVDSNRYRFKFDQCIRDFLTSDKRKVLHLVFERLKLGSIRVVQTFHDMHEKDSSEIRKYTRQFGHIFVHLKQLLNLKFRTEILNSCQDGDKWNLIVIECNVQLAKQIAILYRALSTLISTDDRDLQKIILITKNDDCLAGKFTSDTKFEQEIIECAAIQSGFFDLIESSQKYLYEKGKADMQGNMLNLNQIIDECNRKLIDADTLVTVIDGKRVQIGNRIRTIALAFYIDRLLNIEIEIDENVKLRMEKDNQQHFNILAGTNADFDEFSRRHADRKFNIHWLLKKESGQLIWQNTRGSIAGLVPYRKEFEDQSALETDEAMVDEEKLIECNPKQQIVIISDTPGMGKSTYLASLSKKIKNMWVIRIDLNDYATFLKAQLEKQTNIDTDINSTVEFLLDLLQSHDKSRLKTDLERNLFKSALTAPSRLKFAFLFDGFDEISPTYEELVTNLFLKIRETSVSKLFVTTRPYVQKNLEKKLGIFAYRLRKFSKAEQIEFLTKFWKKQFEEMLSNGETKAVRLEIYVQAIIKKHSDSIQDRDMNFTSNPLQLRMIAEIFERAPEQSEWVGCEEFLQSDADSPELPARLNLIQIYRLFIEKKYRIYREDQMRQNTANVAAQFESEDAFELFRQRHQKMALYSLFENDSLALLLSESEMETIEQFMDKITKGREKHGIIDQIVDRKPRFVHRTFAEYFIAEFFGMCLLRKQIESNLFEFLLRTIFSAERNYRFVRLFLDKWLENERYEGRLVADDTLKEFGRAIERVWSARDEPGFLRIPCREGCFEIIRLICDSLKDSEGEILHDLLNFDDRSGSGTMLKAASENNHLEVLKLLVSYGADVNQQMYGQPILLDALGSGRLPICNWLIGSKDSGGAGANLQELQIYFPVLMFKHAKDGNLVICKWLAEQGIKIDVGFMYGRTPLHIACIEGRLNIVQWLIEMGHDVNAVCSHHNTALHYAALTGKLEVCKWLVSNGINVNARDKAGRMALHMATTCSLKEYIVNSETEHDDDFSGRLDVCKWLVKSTAEGGLGADFQAKTSSGGTVLHTAANCNNSELLEWIIEWDSSLLESLDNRGKTPLLEAACAGHINILESLIKNGANIEVKTNSGSSVFHMAAKEGHVELCQWLLNKTSLVNDRNDGNYTPLQLAAIAGQLKVVQLLIDTEILSENCNGTLHFAAASGSFELCEWLFTSQEEGGRGADINATGELERSVLQFSAVSNWKLVEWLVTHGADFKRKDRNGWTVLHDAAFNGNLEICRGLVTAGAELDTRTKDGSSVLHFAAISGDLDLCKWLVDQGFDIDESSRKGETPFRHAESSGHSELVEWMRTNRVNAITRLRDVDLD